MSSTLAGTVTRTVTVTSGTPSSTLRASPQGGILEGANPSHFDAKNPIVLFIIQAGVIIVFCRLLHWPLSQLRQPRVIAEVVGGILLGPSVMGRIPGFTAALFPPASMPVLSMAANLGLILFLFLVGLEVDMRYLVSNWQIALSVSALGMLLPFGLGAAVAWGLFNEFHDEPGTVPISFGVYLLFIGVAMAITAFPVLCRILTELKLLNTSVGVIVLSAGVGNDVVGWILLALCVGLVNTGTGLTALYVFLCAIGWTLFLTLAVRPIFMRVLRKTGSIQNGPTQSVIALTVLMVLTSSFFTAIIGIHPIFGAFLVGLICPHEGGFAIKVTEKIEDLVSVLLLPLYFALSGLSTNLGLLNTGMTWAYVVAVISIAFFAKLAGGTIAARMCKLVWRESFTVGVLMSCKGLVELIVLNIGLQAKILSQRTFTIFVVMALVTTFATTPLVKKLYPYEYQVKLAAWRRGEIDWDGNRLKPETNADALNGGKEPGQTEVSKVLAHLRLDNVSSVMALISLLARPGPSSIPRIHPSKRQQIETEKNEEAGEPQIGRSSKPLHVHGLRLTELTERESSVMKVSELDEMAENDPVLGIFRTFGQMRHVAISSSVVMANEASYPSVLAENASDLGAGLVILPWSASGAMNEQAPILHNQMASRAGRMSGDIAQAGGSAGGELPTRFQSSAYSGFVLSALKSVKKPSAVLVDNGFGHLFGSSRTSVLSGSTLPPDATHPKLKRTVSAISNRSFDLAHFAPPMPVLGTGHHIFCIFFGQSADDKLALSLTLQMARDTDVTASVVYFEPDADLSDAEGSNQSVNGAEQLYRAKESLESDIQERVVFETVKLSSSTSTSASQILECVNQECGGKTEKKTSAGDLVIFGRGFSENEKGKAVARDDMEVILGALGKELALRVKEGVSLLAVRAGAD